MSISGPPTYEIRHELDCKNWCDTYTEFTETAYKWTIHNFSMRPEEGGKCLESSTFTAGINDKNKWCLRLYPRGFTTDDAGFSSLYLVLKSDNKTAFRAKIKFAILNAKKKLKQEIATECTYNENVRVCGFNKFVARHFLVNEANSLLCDDILVLYCEVKATADSVMISSNKKRSKASEVRLSEDFGKLLESEDFSDVTLTAKGRDIPAHKMVLSIRSPVFEAMFKHEMTETEKNTVEITDIDYGVLKELLAFIYTGKAPNIDKMADTLLVAANKYALDELREMCEEVLSSNVTVDNVLDVLVLADAHSASRLKADAIDFTVLHAIDVMETTGWKTMVAHYPDLLTEVCKSLAVQNASSKRR